MIARLAHVVSDILFQQQKRVLMENLDSLSILERRVQYFSLVRETVQKQGVNHLGNIASQQLIKQSQHYNVQTLSRTVKSVV